MAISQTTVERSQLGRLLLARGLVTDEQLGEAIRLQQSSGQRLGEVLVAQGWVSEQQIARALRKQSNIRRFAAILALLTVPFQMARADDIATGNRDMYSATQHDLINTFESQAKLVTGNSPDLGDVANIRQNEGEANLALILQAGSQNRANIDQMGGSQNTAAIMQSGNNQTASISQSGKQNTAFIIQR